MEDDERRILERERYQIEQILQLDLEELQVEEVDDLLDSSDDDRHPTHGSRGAAFTCELTFNTCIASLHTYLGEVEDTHHRTAFLDGGAVLNLPLFCLEGVVLFPGATLPLRVIEHNLVAAVERVLNQVDVPYTIGVIRVHSDTANHRMKTASVGTTAEIRRYGRLEDGSLNVVTRGQQRFRLRRCWIDVDGVPCGEVQIIEEDIPSRTPRNAFGKLAPLSNLPRNSAISCVLPSKYSTFEVHGSKDGENDSEANSEDSFESELSLMERRIHQAVIGSSYEHDMMDESASSGDDKFMYESDQEIRSNLNDSDTLRSLLSDHRKDAENLESRIGNCSTSGKLSSIAEEPNRCYKNRDANSSHRISRAFWPHWVYRMFDSYWLAQRAADMWKQIVGVPSMDGLVKKPDVLSFYIASKIPVSESTRQELLDIDGVSYRLRREIELLESIDLIRCKRCQTMIAKRSYMLVMSSEGPLGAYVNPNGYVHEVMTLLKANGLSLIGPAVTEYSWFPGFRSALPMMAPSYSGVASNPSYCYSRFPSSRCKISPSCSDGRNVTYVTCHSNCNKSTSQASLFLWHDSTNRRNGMIGGPFCWDPLGNRNLVGQASYSVGTSATILDGIHLESPSHVAEEKVGVLLLNLGGPETLNDVQPFLFNLFADPDIIRLPRLFRFLQRPLAKLISVLRAPKSKEGYAAIGGGSPLRKITDDQALALKMALEAKGLSSNVYVGMRYWYPFTEEAVQQIKTDGITRLVVLPLYPQFSISTTGSSIRVLQQMFREDAYLSGLPVSIINSWYQREGYIKSMADLIEKELRSFSEPEEVMIFFSAHGVPVSYVEDAGDPYRDQMEECIFLIMQELKARGISNEHTLAYQSRVGPVQWLKPYTDEVLVELGQKGVKSLLAVPVSFVSEHIETLEEIDMEYKELAFDSGIKNWARVPALGLTPSFITDLADAVIEALPSASAMYTPTSTPEDVDHDPVTYFIKIFFGSILAFFLLLSPKMMMAFKNLVI